MDIISYSIEWARAEVFSSKFIMLGGLIALLLTLGFFVWGKTPVARAFILPLLLSGIFLIGAGVALYFTNASRVEHFQAQYDADSAAFVRTELDRTAQSDHDLALMVYKVLPTIAILAALGILLSDKPFLRFLNPSWCITIIALSGILMLIDANTHRRNADYRAVLSQFETSASVSQPESVAP